MVFEADETGEQQNSIIVQVPIVDDDVNEADEEVFVVSLSLSEPNDRVSIARNSSLCRITDDDSKCLLLHLIVQVLTSQLTIVIHVHIYSSIN